MSEQEVLEVAVQQAFESLLQSCLDLLRVLPDQLVRDEPEGAAVADDPIGEGDRAVCDGDVEGTFVVGQHVDVDCGDPRGNLVAVAEDLDAQPAPEVVGRFARRADRDPEGIGETLGVAMVVATRQ